MGNTKEEILNVALQLFAKDTKQYLSVRLLAN